jgi:hypothetical protein
VKNDPNRIDYSASQSGDWTCIRRLFRPVEFRSARPINPLRTKRYPRGRPHDEASRGAGRLAVDVDARLRAPRESHADVRLCRDPRGCDGGVCQELAAGVGGASRKPETWVALFAPGQRLSPTCTHKCRSINVVTCAGELWAKVGDGMKG